jgi:hypothetical protein
MSLRRNLESRPLTSRRSSTGEEKQTGPYAGGLPECLKSRRIGYLLRSIFQTGMDVAQIRYQENFRKITELTAATKDLAKGQEAYNLALDVFLGKTLTKPGPVEDITGELTMPGLPALPSGSASPVPTLTLAKLAALPPESPDQSSSTLKALKKESELTASSFAQLAKAFPNLSEAEVAALPAGQKMIDQLSHLEKHGKQAIETLADLRDQLIAEGNDLSGHLVQDLGSGIKGAEGQLTNLLSGKRFNFVSTAQDLGQSVMGSFISKGVSSMLGKFGAGGAKADGSAANPFYVVPSDESGNPLSGSSGSSLPGLSSKTLSGIIGPMGGVVPTFPTGDKGTFGGITSELGGLLKGAGGGILGTIGKFAGMFGGFLAGGGDVSPGKAYMVGEKHPEFFVPKASGRVVPTIKSQPGKSPMVYAPVYNISTPNVDSFRKSHNQIVTEGYRTAALAHARNS